MSTVAVQAPALPKTPYRGLKPYRYADRAIFFAREPEKRALFRKVTMYRGVLLYGDQGSGKSSLINAGLLPEAIEEGFAPERIRVQPKLCEEIIIERVVASDEPGAPFLASLFAEGASGATQLTFSVEEFERRTEAFERGPAPLLIFDQFEEWVTLSEEAQKQTRSDEPAKAQQRILDLVVRLLRARESQVHVLFVFREDFLARLNRLFVLCPELTNQYVYLTPPPASVLLEIIRGPFESTRLPENHFGRELSPDLSRRLAAAFEEQHAGGRINLAEVQIVCLRLWNSADPEGEFERRGVSGLLEDFLSDSLTRIDKKLQPAALALLARLVTSSGTRNVVAEEDLLSLARKDRHLPENVFRDALNKLVKEASVVRRERRNQTYTYEIVSEFLVPWIYRYRIKSMAAIERRRWIIRGAIFMLAIALIGAAVSYWVVTQNSEKAQKDKLVKQAESERRNAEKLSGQLKDLLDSGKSVDVRLRDAGNAIANLTTDLDNAKKSIAMLSAERDKWQKQAEVQSSRADDALKQLGLASQGKSQAESAGKSALDEANKKIAQYEGQIANLNNQIKDLKDQPDKAKVQQTAPPPQPQQQLKPGAPTPSTEPGPLKTKTNAKDGLNYVWIPSGTFTMGCSPGDMECFSEEKPPHKVEITRGFWMGQTEVTQAAYEKLMKRNPSYFKGANRPVERVTWNQAKAYCEAVSMRMRLPTEAEWEYAARAGSRESRYGALDQIAWYFSNSKGQTQPVAAKSPNALGLYDMLGNVWEWTADWYDKDYYNQKVAKDPQGPSSPTGARVVRGGSWDVVSRIVRASYRYRFVPVVRYSNLGFRCVGELR